MLKGYTKIELTNVHTGEKEVVEKHNLITNNLKRYFEKTTLIQGLRYGKDNICPLYDIGMGGIVLLSDSIAEDADAYHISYSSVDVLTGCAHNAVNTGTDTKIGSRNLSESKILANGYKYVWDFGTSQANGAISTVALTNAYACMRPGTVFAYPQSFAIVKFDEELTGLWEYLTDYDFEQNIATVIRVVDSSTVSVTKYKFDLSTVHLLDRKDTSHLHISKLKLSESLVQSSLELNQDGFWIDGFDGYYYYIYVQSYNAQYIARMSKDTLQIDTSYGLTEINLELDSSTYTERQYISKYCAIANGYLYTPGGYNVNYQKVNLSDLSEIVKITGSDKLSIGSECASDGKMIYTFGNVLFPDDTYIHYCYGSDYLQYSFWAGVERDDYQPKIIMSKYGDCLYVDSSRYQVIFGYCMNNLCTINNLETPVTKTADKTMKITYTITEE